MDYTLITGASSGIGKELALIAAKDGRNLVLVARSKSDLGLVKELIIRQASSCTTASADRQDDTLRVEIFAIDLSLNTSAEKVYEFCKQKNISVTELINNAGFGDYGKFASSDLSRQLNMIDLNIRSLTELTHLFLPKMISNGSGKIMNVGSVASFLPGPLMSVYFASKNYVLRFSEALSEELVGSGVSVTCLCPGPTKTSFGKSAHVSKTHSTANPRTTAQQVAAFGWKHMQVGTRVAIHGISNRIAIQLTRFVPRNLVAKLVKIIQR